jgi:outer membrane usher protein FimD/PapC
MIPFTFEGESLAASAVSKVSYENASVPVSIFYDGSSFESGTYRVDIYIDGRHCGSGSTYFD